MSLDEATVARVARLARIAVPESEHGALARELSGILGWVEQLGLVATDDVQPLQKVMAIPTPLREDRVADGERAEEVLANAPERQDGWFVVPKVVE